VFQAVSRQAATASVSVCSLTHTPLICRHNLGVVGHQAPITVVVVRTRLLAAIAGGHAVNVHHGDHRHIRMLPQPSRFRLIAKQPFDEAPCHPR
jgi:hypothetical protein